MFDHTLARTTSEFPLRMGWAHTLEDLLTRATEATRALAERVLAEAEMVIDMAAGAGIRADTAVKRSLGCDAGPMTNNPADIIIDEVGVTRDSVEGDPKPEQSEKWRNK